MPSKRKLYPREESVWRNMITRCHNEKATGYSIYGGRGIHVCQSWRYDFYAFLSDMGARPAGMTLDRINNDVGYNKANCRWTTQKEQCNNTSRNVWLDYNGESMTIAQWAEALNIKCNTLQYRLYRGWPLERALS